MIGIELAERGWLPDSVIRQGIRRMLEGKRREIASASSSQRRAARARWVEELRQSPIAPVPRLANQQHYEVDPDFFRQVLGSRLKYSCGWWPDADVELDLAEDRMLDLTCERAGILDGMRVLDLGCGWGSLALWVAERHPGCRVVAVSNSKLQREFILGRVRERGLENLEVRTADVNTFAPEGRFDRIVSVEMFEHTRNWERLLARIGSWLAPQGRLFVHHFCHREAAYPYVDRDDGDWMARHFFSGGQMPSYDLLRSFARDLAVEQDWLVGGLHYRRTCEAWLHNLDARRAEAWPALVRTYGSGDAARWYRRWRIFFLACSELFGYRGGEEWFVGHYRLAPTPRSR